MSSVGNELSFTLGFYKFVAIPIYLLFIIATMQHSNYFKLKVGKGNPDFFRRFFKDQNFSISASEK